MAQFGFQPFGTFDKELSIKDLSPKGEGGGYKKCPKRRRSLVDLRRQEEGGYTKNLKFGETPLMDGPRRLFMQELLPNLKLPSSNKKRKHIFVNLSLFIYFL